MSETVKFRTFCGQPMGNKPVGDVPGVGPIAARKLRAMDYTKATHLYDRLKRLNFDVKRFRVWATLNCKGAKVSAIYKALMGWHAQFGEQQNDDSENEAEEEIPQTRPNTSRSARATRTPARRPRNSVQFDLSGTDGNNVTVTNNIPDFNNPLTLFFASFSDSCKNILQEFHTDLKVEVLGIVGKYEQKSRERQRESMPSTSQAMNGS